MTDVELIDKLRRNLKPKGTAPIVCLHMNSPSMYSEDFIQQCLSELEKKILLFQVGLEDNSFSPLDQLSLQVLMDSACIESK